MKCPRCGFPEKARVKVCPECGQAYATEDLLALSQLEFLLQEADALEVAKSLLAPYVQRLEALRVRLQPAPASEPAVAAELVPEPEVAAEVAPPAAPRERVPFDQWLLSERNIKLALYAGGVLLLLAGIIFIGVQWTRIPGPGKLAITLMITGLMYLGGYVLFQRRAFRLGGIALLGVASGFLTLNFAVLQIYLLGPGGLRDDVMWLIASPLCLLLYIVTAYWTRADLFTYISLVAVASTLTAALVVISAPGLLFLPAYALLALAILVLARVFQSTTMSDFTRLPLLVVSHVAMPLIIIGGIVGWIVHTGCGPCLEGTPWLALLAMSVGALFYVVNDWTRFAVFEDSTPLWKALSAAVYEWRAVRWVAAVLFALTLTLVLAELHFGNIATGITLMVLALAYLGVGYALELREGRRASGWPLYATAYALAVFVTWQAIPSTGNLAKVLLGDVAVLTVSAAIHREYSWVYGAAWLLMLPVYLFTDLFVPALTYRGLLMGLLGLNYAAAGYVLGRRQLRLGGPFLTAAAFLSIVVVLLTWGSPIVAGLVLASIAVLYLLAALWLGWEWLLLAALLAANLCVLAINGIFFKSFATLLRPLIISYAALGVVLVLGGLGLRRAGQSRWAWPLYIAGAAGLGGAFAAGLFVGWWLAIGLSAVLAAILLAFAWFERTPFAEQNLPPVLAYLGIGSIFVGHFYVIGVTLWGRNWDVWPGFTAGLCGLFVVLAWLLQREPIADLSATPLRRAGLSLLAVPMAGALFIFEPATGAVTFAIAGVIYAADAAVRRVLNLAYLGAGAFVVVIWALLMLFNVSEPQAYVIPFGVALLGGGWNERLRGRSMSYLVPTLVGLALLMGSALYQSLPRGAFVYALLLGVESLAALGWGIGTRSRGYVQCGALALIANALVQLGPGLIELPRWIQLGVTGGILLGGGLAALFKREQILAARHTLTQEWRQWER
jgi:hypothetical protein